MCNVFAATCNAKGAGGHLNPEQLDFVMQNVCEATCLSKR